MRRVAFAAAVAAALLVPSTATAETWAWFAYGHDVQLTNDVASSSLTTQNARDTKLLWQAKLDGAVVASPLSARVRVNRRSVQLLFVTTEAGSVYALAADTGEVVWQRTFPTVTTDSCGTYGFSSTGVVDTKRGLLFEGGADGSVHALGLATGDEDAPWPLELLDRPRYEYVWGGLQLVEGRLYVPVASYCDEPDPEGVAAEGRLVAVDPDTAVAAATFDTVPGQGNLGGIWGWGGIAAEPTDDVIYTGVGNSYVFSDACGCYIDDSGYGDRIVALSPDLSQVSASNKPAQVPGLGDEDFGAAPLVFEPDGCPPLLAAKNKIGVLFIWNRLLIDEGPIAALGVGDGTAPFVGAPSYDPARGTLVVSQAVVPGAGTGYGLAAFTPGGKCDFAESWRVSFGAGNQPPPIIVSNVVFASGGNLGGFAAFSVVNGDRLWDFPTEASTISPLIEVGGNVFGGDVDGNVYSFGVGPFTRLHARCTDLGSRCAARRVQVRRASENREG